MLANRSRHGNERETAKGNEGAIFGPRLLHPRRDHPRRSNSRKDFAAMKLETHSPTFQTDSGATGLLILADLILGSARQLENLASWRDFLQRHHGAVNAGEAPLGRVKPVIL